MGFMRKVYFSFKLNNNKTNFWKTKRWRWYLLGVRNCSYSL